MTTTQAVLCGVAGGFLIASLLWVLLGMAIGILQTGIEDALREKLNLNEKGKNENGSKK